MVVFISDVCNDTVRLGGQLKHSSSCDAGSEWWLLHLDDLHLLLLCEASCFVVPLISAFVSKSSDILSSSQSPIKTRQCYGKAETVSFYLGLEIPPHCQESRRHPQGLLLLLRALIEGYSPGMSVTRQAAPYSLERDSLAPPCLAGQ